jgi:hypothetical protein
VRQKVCECVEDSGVALRLDHHAFTVVTHEAGQPAGTGQAVNEWPKADPLDDTTHQETAPLDRLRRRERHR